MSSGFDPYHQWLGIPPKHQPPDYYRLLGIKRFEDDPAVIRAGVERQMSVVRKHQLGKYVKLSQTVLNELGSARACLLNPKKKNEYDRTLQTETESKRQATFDQLPVARLRVPLSPGESEDAQDDDAPYFDDALNELASASELRESAVLAPALPSESESVGSWSIWGYAIGGIALVALLSFVVGQSLLAPPPVNAPISPPVVANTPSVSNEVDDVSTDNTKATEKIEELEVVESTPKIAPPPNVIFVDAVATAGGDGSGWSAAFRNLSDAIASTAKATEPKQIWVAAGQYRPSASGDRTAAFVLRNNIELLGGFQGSESSADDRQPLKNLTVLSGDLSGDDKSAFANRGDNSFHVVISKDNDATAVLDGFIVTGGNASGKKTSPGAPEDSQPDQCDGGGLVIRGGAPTIRNCVFTSNEARLRGGGVCTWRSTALLENCTLVNNRGPYGGGMVNYGARTPKVEGRLNIIDCVFWQNNSQRGGGVLHWWGVECVLSRCVIGHNQANSTSGYMGGGGVYSDACNAHFIDCWIIKNSSSGLGGGIVTKWRPQTKFTHCTIADNEAAPKRGGAIFTLNGGHPTLENCVVWGNRHEAFNTGGGSGGASIRASASCIQGGWAGSGNTDAPPSFQSADDYTTKDGTTERGSRGRFPGRKINELLSSL